MAYCRACGKKDTHYCEVEDRTVTKSDPLLSAVVAAATDSTILGTLVGGSLTGALLGDLLDGDILDD